MFSTLLKQKYSPLLLLLGVLLLTVSFFKIDDISKFQISQLANPIYPLFAIGMLLVVFSLLIFALDGNYLAWRFSSRIRSTKNGYSIRIAESDLNVSFGQIEECEATAPECIVVLPANEFFDDECISDKNSALGAYIQKAFPAHVDKIRELIAQELEKLEFQNVEKEVGCEAKSYGIAKYVFLDKPLGSNRKIVLISVTTKRAGQGLRSEPHHLLLAIKSIERFMVDHRFRELHLPLMGSGHGGLRKELALLNMVLAVAELLNGPSRHSFRSVNIVLFQADAKSKPPIPHRAVKRILSFAVSMIDKVA
jgi:hypothetical protein